jgi:hypothetical protein
MGDRLLVSVDLSDEISTLTLQMLLARRHFIFYVKFSFGEQAILAVLIPCLRQYPYDHIANFWGEKDSSVFQRIF